MVGGVMGDKIRAGHDPAVGAGRQHLRFADSSKGRKPGCEGSHHNLPLTAASYILRISGTPSLIGLPPAVGSTAAISASLSRCSIFTPSSASVWGIPTS